MEGLVCTGTEGCKEPAFSFLWCGSRLEWIQNGDVCGSEERKMGGQGVHWDGRMGISALVVCILFDFPGSYDGHHVSLG